MPNKCESFSSKEFAAKLNAMNCYKSQIKSFPKPICMEALWALVIYRGNRVIFERSEAFDHSRN